jgi:aspartyl-tRNA(Asn)/glutamyl-tRNA(Gln) amidotransferase subunit A
MTPLRTLLDDLNAGRTTSRALVEAALARATDPAGEGARVFIKLHADAALAAADAVDTQRKAGAAVGPLAGIPISVKDLFDLKGDVTTAGSTLLKSAPPATADAPAIARLRAAGAIVVGRTNMVEFAYSGLGLNPHYGTPANPWDRATRRIPGGSSSGAAISVTDGMAAAAIGSDTGGSVRIPAALCGLAGFKPTARRIPTEGAYPLSFTLDSVGALAPALGDSALLDSIMAGEAPHVPEARPLSGLRLAVPRTLVFDNMDAPIEQQFDATAAKLSAGGAKITGIDFTQLAEIPKLNAAGGIYAEAWALHRKQLEAHEAEYDPRVATRIRRPSAMSAADYIDVIQARSALIREADAVTAEFDAVILPTTALLAPPIAALEADEDLYTTSNVLMLRNTFCFNFLDRCAATVPMHEAGAPPCGLMVVGETMGDEALLSVALGIEAALRG